MNTENEPQRAFSVNRQGGEYDIRSREEFARLQQFFRDRAGRLIGQAIKSDNSFGYARRADTLFREIARTYDIDPNKPSRNSQDARNFVIGALGIDEARRLLDGFSLEDIWRTFTLGDDGKYYGTIRQIASTYGLSDSVVRRMISETKPPSFTKEERTLYQYEGPLADELERYDALEKSPRAVGSEVLGMVEVQEPSARTVNALARQFEITRQEIMKILLRLEIPPTTGRGASGKENELYKVTDELIDAIEAWKTIPVVDENGFVDRPDGRYGLLNAFAKKTGWSRPHIKSKITGGAVKVRKITVRVLGRGGGAAPGMETFAYHEDDIIGQLEPKHTH